MPETIKVVVKEFSIAQIMKLAGKTSLTWKKHCLLLIQI